MAWEENPRICLHMQLIAILSRTGVIDNTIASFLVVVPLLVSTLGLKATVLAEAKPLTRVNKDNHTNRNALFLFITFEVCENHPTSKHTLGEEYRSIRHLLGLIIK